MFENNKVRLAVLTLLHFTVDFYAGLRGPIIPTLTIHLATTLKLVIYLTASCGIIVNAVQPTFGAFVAKKGFPFILVAGPVLAAAMGLIGLSHSYMITAFIFAFAAFGVGLVHPEAVMAANDISVKRLGLGMSIFMSGGYLGYSSGSLVAGWWGQKLGLDYFWILSVPGLMVAVFIYLTGLHKFRAEAASLPEERDENAHSFWPVFALGVMLAINIVLIINFFTVYMMEKFGKDYQGFAGTGLFLFGVCGAIGGCLWGHLSEGKKRITLVFIATLIALPFSLTFYDLDSTAMILVWLAFMGLTMNACFPITVILAQSARQFTRPLRTGLAIGGTWGLGMASSAAAGYFTVFFKVEEILRFSTVAFLLASVLISGIMSFSKKKTGL
ncbi:MAG: MFS transporter [Planctomycetota bacterium]|jgi:FSR family fosmidomycin resistance protein-like MFS transporter